VVSVTEWAVIARGFSDLVFPPTCIHCGGLVENSDLAPTAITGPASAEAAADFRQLCPLCVALLDWVTAPYCSTCGHPFFGQVEGERTCPHCVGLLPAFNTGCTAVLFRGPARSLVIELKYHQGLQAISDMEAIFRRAPHVLALARDAILVPVPLHPRKRRERGYNQAELLAHALARVAGGSTRVIAILRRVIDTPTQTAFDRRTRLGNLKNAFALTRGAALNRAHHYILVDDVFTTGSTLNSCARTLRRAGCLNVDVVTLGHG
jgi:ComF family protein